MDVKQKKSIEFSNREINMYHPNTNTDREYRT